MVKTLNKEELEDRTEAKRDMKMWLTADWELVEETPSYFLMRKNTGSVSGHIWVALFTLWWTFGIQGAPYQSGLLTSSIISPEYLQDLAQVHD